MGQGGAAAFGPAGGHFPRITCHDPPFGGCSIRAGLKAHVCLPGSASPPACRAQPHLLPAGGLLHLLPAGALLHLQPAGGRRLDGADRQPIAPRLPDRYAEPSPPDVRTPAKWHLL